MQSSKELLEFYQKTGPTMFDKQFILKRWHALYKSEPLKTELQETFGAETTLKPDDLECLLLAVTRNRTTDSPWPIRIPIVVSSAVACTALSWTVKSVT
jgi:hypothetical protein